MTPASLTAGLIVTVRDVYKSETFTKYTPDRKAHYRRVQVLEVDGQNQPTLLEALGSAVAAARQDAITDPDPDPWVLVEALEHVVHGPNSKRVMDDQRPRMALRGMTWEASLQVGALAWVRSRNLYPGSKADEQEAQAHADLTDRELIAAEGLDTFDPQPFTAPPILLDLRKVAALIRERDTLASVQARADEIVAAAEAEEQAVLEQADRARDAIRIREAS